MEYLKNTLESVAGKIKEEWDSISLKFVASNAQQQTKNNRSRGSRNKRKASQTLVESKNKFVATAASKHEKWDLSRDQVPFESKRESLVFPPRSRQKSVSDRHGIVASELASASDGASLNIALDTQISFIRSFDAFDDLLVFPLHVETESEQARKRKQVSTDIMIPSFRRKRKQHSKKAPPFSGAGEESVNEDAYMSLHRKYEILEKRLRIREAELFKHERYRQQVEQERFEHAVLNKLPRSQRSSMSNLIANTGLIGDLSTLQSSSVSLLSESSLSLAVSTPQCSLFDLQSPVKASDAEALEGIKCTAALKKNAAFEHWLHSSIPHSKSPPPELSDKQKAVSTYIANTSGLVFDNKHFHLSRKACADRRVTDRSFALRQIEEFWKVIDKKIPNEFIDFKKSFKKSKLK